VSARILIVDDAAFMRSTLRNILGRGGFTVVAEAKNGREAVELYALHLPDLVTMDIVMPELSGIEAVRIITRAHPSAKIIMCSAMGQQALVIEAIQAGARDFVIKPFQAARVIEAVVRGLES
jgi:two-component system chemotaxis response regulator CheY